MNEGNSVELLIASLVVIGFILIFKLSRLAQQVSRMGKLTRNFLSVMADVSLQDEDKEKSIKKIALRLFGYFFTITISAFASLFIPIGIVWLADREGMLSFDAILNIALSWEFLLVTTIVGTGAYFLLRERKTAIATSGDSFEVNYSSSERILHDIAFATTEIQVGLSRLEDRLYAKSLKLEEKPPVFITGLPRAGTTLLMELCYNSGAFATHTYRQMPFVLIPLLWYKFSKNFATNDKPRERAHGDGMMVSLDSPEAFEEMLWINFWPWRYKKKGIKPWTEKGKDQFLTFFSKHRQKIIALNKQKDPLHCKQYISKNNLNIARIPWLLKNVKGSKVIVPFREPFQHCGSLLKQHKLFLDLHPKDPFAKNYMRAVGHFDFGENLKPVNFNNWMDNNPILDTTDISFWLLYWIATYEELLKWEGDRVRLINFDKFCAEPRQTLSKVATFLELDHPENLIREADKIRLARKHPALPENVEPELIKQVNHLYKRLQANALN